MAAPEHSYQTQIVGADGTTVLETPTLTPWAVQQASLAAVRDQVSEAGYNGSTYDQLWGNIDITLLASAARTTQAQGTSADQTNINFRGILIFLNVTVASGTGGLQIRIQGKDPVSGVYQSLHTIPTAIIATGMTTYQLGSVNLGTSANMGQSATVILPRTWRLLMVVGDASSYTYSVGASLVRG